MFCVRQMLRFSTCLVRAECSVYHHAPIICKLNNTITFRENRFVHEDANGRKELGKLEEKMKLIFTCKRCNTRNSKIISKLAYNKGVIIVRCDGCKNNHLIADNLGWFGEITSRTNIEKLMALKGETVKKVIDDIDGYYEAIAKEEFKELPKNPKEKAMTENSNECSVKIEKTGALKDS